MEMILLLGQCGVTERTWVAESHRVELEIHLCRLTSAMVLSKPHNKILGFGSLIYKMGVMDFLMSMPGYPSVETDYLLVMIKINK